MDPYGWLGGSGHGPYAGNYPHAFTAKPKKLCVCMRVPSARARACVCACVCVRVRVRATAPDRVLPLAGPPRQNYFRPSAGFPPQNISEHADGRGGPISIRPVPTLPKAAGLVAAFPMPPPDPSPPSAFAVGMLREQQRFRSAFSPCPDYN